METTLYDGGGRPVAYIADDGEHSIYMWQGHAVAYVEGEDLYGWNGHHLGWYIDGVLYNHSGRPVGSIGGKCPLGLYTELAKHDKFKKYGKFTRAAPSARPALTSSYAQETLEEFLKSGAVNAV